jgi:hypothetical protein
LSGLNIPITSSGKDVVVTVKYAGFVNTIITNYWRFTHNKDIVPHVPPISVFGYLHSCREVFEDENGVLKICSESNCEDPKCANQFSLAETNTDDHSFYLGHKVDCESSVSIS